MFTRTVRNRRGWEYRTVVEGIRESGRVRQKHLVYLGSARTIAERICQVEGQRLRDVVSVGQHQERIDNFLRSHPEAVNSATGEVDPRFYLEHWRHVREVERYTRRIATADADLIRLRELAEHQRTEAQNGRSGDRLHR